MEHIHHTLSCDKLARECLIGFFLQKKASVEPQLGLLPTTEAFI